MLALGPNKLAQNCHTRILSQLGRFGHRRQGPLPDAGWAFGQVSGRTRTGGGSSEEAATEHRGNKDEDEAGQQGQDADPEGRKALPAEVDQTAPRPDRPVAT